MTEREGAPGGAQARRVRLPIPLLAVFGAGFYPALAVSGLFENVRFTDLPTFLEAVVAMSPVSLPLTVYAVAFGETLCRAGLPADGRPALTWRLPIYLVIAIATLGAFPQAILFLIEIVIAGGGSPFAMPMVLGALCGTFYGVFLSLMTALLLRRWPPHRPLAHVLGGAAVGFLVIFPYLFFGLGAAVSGWEKDVFTGLLGTAFSAAVLALCYAPHAFLTRPWQGVPVRDAGCRQGQRR